MEQNQNPANGQEQNYDYIFEELDRQEQLRSGKILIKHPDGRSEPATGKKFLKVFLPVFIFFGAVGLMIAFAESNPMVTLVIFGMIFMGVAIFASHVGGGKLRPQPMMYLFFIAGLATSYAGAASMICQAKPFDMDAFTENSVCGFGIGTAILGIVLIVCEIIRIGGCRTEVMATCREIKRKGRVNGHPFGTVTWEYEWDYNSYTEKTYNTIIGELCEGTTEMIFINPANPKAIRLKGQTGAWGWGVFYTAAGIVLIWASTMLRSGMI